MADSVSSTTFIAVTLTLVVCGSPIKETVNIPTLPPSLKNSIPGAVLQSVRKYHERIAVVLTRPAGPGPIPDSDNNSNAAGPVEYGSIPGTVLQSVNNATNTSGPVQYGSIPGAVLQSAVNTATNTSVPVPFGSIPGAVLLSTKGGNSHRRSDVHERRRKAGLAPEVKATDRKEFNLDQPQGP